ncbi:Fructosamine kinase-domain-containing protein [Xylariaceae sp. FL1272]|nr:Fructosamine kinase-domain-containing protein [Xylariaceae sp. FL1272]
MEIPTPKQPDPKRQCVELDGSILKALPSGCKVVCVEASGKSLWAETVKIEVKLTDGTSSVFFKKGASNKIGYDMMKGGFEAEKALHEFVPEFVPRPIAYGTYKTQPDTHFYISEFVEMLDEVPSACGWASAVAALHKRSMGRGPTAQFGFPTTTHLANVPVDNSWNPSWEKFWAQQMKSLLDREEALHGSNAEYTKLKQAFFDVVIPRYLRPLQSNGRSIDPCLCHSDLWPGNIKPRRDSDLVSMFDSCAYWGHNEADLGICRNPRYKLGKSFIEQYQTLLPISDPKADFDGRNAVYAMKYHVLLSVLYHKEDKFRKIAICEMRSLVERANNSTSI